jgi:hypothetical protein
MSLHVLAWGNVWTVPDLCGLVALLSLTVC